MLIAPVEVCADPATLIIGLTFMAEGIEFHVNADFDVETVGFGLIFAGPCGNCTWERDSNLNLFTASFGTPFVTDEGENMFAVSVSSSAAHAFGQPRPLSLASPRAFRLGELKFNGPDPGILRPVNFGDPAVDDLLDVVGTLAGDASAPTPAEGVIDCTKNYCGWGPTGDSDEDGVLDFFDNCPDIANPDQTNTDGGGPGDACNDAQDRDGDEWEDPRDNCPDIANPDQTDTDRSGVGNACNDPQDADGDEWEDPRDNCPDVANADQVDTDRSGIGDACNDAQDADGDEWEDPRDNCPDESNPDQTDEDRDGIGDVCDPFPDRPDNELAQCEADLVAAQSALQQCLIGSDIDGDLILDSIDNCPTVPNLNQNDSDGDGVGDACDNCRCLANPRASPPPRCHRSTGGQVDDDVDGVGNVCDGDFTESAGDNFKNADDLLRFLEAFGHPVCSRDCPDSDGDPFGACARYDLTVDGEFINVNDLLVMIGDPLFGRPSACHGCGPADDGLVHCPLECEAGEGALPCP